MNNEIKEILDGFKEILDNPTTTDECYDGRIIEVDRSYDLDLDEIKLLLDYITNLQEYYNDNVNRYEELIEKYSNLQQEIDRLNNIINELEKWLKEQIKIKNKCISNCAGTREYELLRKNEQDLMFFNWVLDKLKELKEEDKNE